MLERLHKCKSTFTNAVGPKMFVILTLSEVEWGRMPVFVFVVACSFALYPNSKSALDGFNTNQDGSESYGMNRPCRANFHTPHPSATSDPTITPTPTHRIRVADSVPARFRRTFSANSVQSAT